MKDHVGTRSGHVVGGKSGQAERRDGVAPNWLRRMPASRGLLTVAILVLVLTLISTSSQGGAAFNWFETGIDDFPVTHFGTDGNTSLGVYAPSMAYNSRSNEFLVVWEGASLPTTRVRSGDAESTRLPAL
jgi:hypothetical protein